MAKISILELSSVLVQRYGLNKRDASIFVSAMFDIIQSALERDRLVKVKGLGTFKIIDVDDRESVDVNTGERVLIEGHGKITFTPDQMMKELVNKPFSQFETVVLNDGVEIEENNNSDEMMGNVVDPTNGTAGQDVTIRPGNEPETAPLVDFVTDEVSEFPRQTVEEFKSPVVEEVYDEDEDIPEWVIEPSNVAPTAAAVPPVSAATSGRPTETIRPVQQPSTPVEPVRPVQQPVRPVESVRPVQQPVRPVEPVRPAQQPVRPVESVRPVQQPVHQADPLRPVTRPVTSSEPVHRVSSPSQGRIQNDKSSVYNTIRNVSSVNHPIQPEERVEPVRRYTPDPVPTEEVMERPVNQPFDISDVVDEVPNKKKDKSSNKKSADKRGGREGSSGKWILLVLLALIAGFFAGTFFGRDLLGITSETKEDKALVVEEEPVEEAAVPVPDDLPEVQPTQEEEANEEIEAGEPVGEEPVEGGEPTNVPENAGTPQPLVPASPTRPVSNAASGQNAATMQSTAKPAQPVTKPNQSTKKPVQTTAGAAKATAPTAKPAVTSPTASKSVKPKTQVKATAPVADNAPLDKYQKMDIRVRTGAYRITGTDYVVKVVPGDNAEKIARRTLGKDMSCYIEVYNGIKGATELEPGSVIKIPKLELKRK